MRRLLAVLAAGLVLALAACLPRAQPRRETPPPAPAPPEPAPPAPSESAGMPPAAADPTPELEGGPEDGGRPHEDPAQPPAGVYLRGDRRYPLVALTFDDGPDRTFTPRVLDVLRRERAPATFFLVGTRAEKNPDVVRRIVREGHEVGNHSYSHANLARLAPQQIDRQLRRADRVLTGLTGRKVRVFRPPYGEVTPAVTRVAGALGYRTVLWNVDSLDWKRTTTAQDVVNNVVPRVRRGSIILHHSAGGKGEDLTNTVQALPQIIRTLRARGYRLVTVSELLATGRPVPGQW